jgi:hypothetical protein
MASAVLGAPQQRFCRRHFGPDGIEILILHKIYKAAGYS